MYQPAQHTITFSKNLSYVNSCPNSPAHSMAFCNEHIEVIKQLGIPVTLKEFLKYKKEHNITEINASTLSVSAADCQGYIQLLCGVHKMHFVIFRSFESS